jgi:hypothetical protein
LLTSSLHPRGFVSATSVSPCEMIWAPVLQAYVTIGDFVLASVQEMACPSICRIVDAVAPNELRVTWWWRPHELSVFDGLQVLPPLSDATHRNLQLCRISEVCERVQSVSTINVNLVRDIVIYISC